MVVDDGQYRDKNMTRIQLYWKNEGWGVCYNLCFPLAQLATTTRNQPYSMKTLMMKRIMTKARILTMPGMTLKMAEIELMSAALEAAVFTFYTIFSLSNLCLFVCLFGIGS